MSKSTSSDMINPDSEITKVTQIQFFILMTRFELSKLRHKLRNLRFDCYPTSRSRFAHNSPDKLERKGIPNSTKPAGVH